MNPFKPIEASDLFNSDSDSDSDSSDSDSNSDSDSDSEIPELEDTLWTQFGQRRPITSIQDYIVNSITEKLHSPRFPVFTFRKVLEEYLFVRLILSVPRPRGHYNRPQMGWFPSEEWVENAKKEMLTGACPRLPIPY